MTKMYYQDAVAIIVAFSLCSASSFDNLTTWMKDIDKNTDNNFILIIVGTKSDLDDQKEVT